MKRITTTIGLLIFTILCFTACTEDETEYSVVGTWDLISDIRTYDFSMTITDSLGNEQTLTCNDFDQDSCSFFCEWDGDSCEAAVENYTPGDGESGTLTLNENNTLTLDFSEMASCEWYDDNEEGCENMGCTYTTADDSCSGEDFIDTNPNTGTWLISGGTLTVSIIDDDDEEPEIESFSYVVDETTLNLTQTFSAEDYDDYLYDDEINLSGEWQLIFERE